MSSVDESDVLVLGASFAGIEVLHQLVRYTEGRPPKTTVVDRMPRHGYLPLVQERLCGHLDPVGTELDTRAYVRSVAGARFVCDEVVSFDPTDKIVSLASGARLRARFVVVALGSVSRPPSDLPGASHFHCYKGASEFDASSSALSAACQPGRAPHLAVVGGGVSGVELAAELAQRLGLRGEGTDEGPRVTLLSGSQRLLADMPARLGAAVASRLNAAGIDIRFGARVVEARPDGLTLEEGSGDARQTVQMPIDLALWSAGIRPAPVLGELGLPRTAHGWLAVGPTLQCFASPTPTRPDVFACGDAVRICGGDGEWNTMPRAIEAIWQAKVVVRNLLRLSREPEGYPSGVPPLSPHRRREKFFYGISLGPRSLVAYGGLWVDLAAGGRWFRRWLMRQYFARYRPRATPPA